MIIDSQKFNGECSCGRNHKMQTLLSVVESGCLNNIDEYSEKYGLTGCRVTIYDENTYKATDGKHPKADCEIVLNSENLHANEIAVENVMSRLPDEAKVLVAIGSGTVHDITRYCAYKKNIDFISCPTAASVDGFCSSVAAMTWKGYKKTFIAVSPKLVLADLDIIKNAPLRLAKSGFGDMIGKYIALADWKIANIISNEFYCKRISDLSREAANAVLDSADGIANRDETSFEKLMYGLLLSGIAMQMMGNSRPASGAEHHISHLIEMSPAGLNVSSDALHGEKVGVGTVIASNEYHRIAKFKNIVWRNYAECDADYIKNMFGKNLSDEILEENRHDCAKGITADSIEKAFHEIIKAIEEIPDAEKLLCIYKKLGIKSCLEDICVSDDLKPKLMEYSPYVRNRLTLMRLRKCISTHN